MGLAEARRRDGTVRRDTRARLSAVYAEGAQRTPVLSFRQRDCIVQYIGEVSAAERAPRNPPCLWAYARARSFREGPVPPQLPPHWAPRPASPRAPTPRPKIPVPTPPSAHHCPVLHSRLTARVPPA